MSARVREREDTPPSGVGRLPHNLRSQPTPLIGREATLAEARVRLFADQVRLLTLTGPGGTGKTRLAVEVAASVLDHFADGAWFVDLSPLVDPRLVAPLVAKTLGIDTTEQPALVLLQGHLRDSQRLLVLDNFEQVLPAAIDVATLLSACPGLKVLATSRAPLDLTWEHVFPVPPLALPDPAAVGNLDHLARSPSVALFVERARAARGEFALAADNAAAVAQICVRLDGLPLAIELAAARSRLLPPTTLLGRLQRRVELLRFRRQDSPARHNTMAGAIAWSYDLLLEDERALFRRSSVFVGGFGPDAAEAIAPDLDALEGLDSLVNKSLLRVDDVGGEPRYRLLETVREYALARLQECDEEQDAHHRHADYLLALVGQAASELRGPRQATWLDRFEREHDNLRAALAWSLEHDLDTALRLGGGLWRFWFTRGYMLEGQEWLEAALARSSEAPGVSSLARAAALTGAGEMAWGRGEVDRAATRHRASLMLRRELGDLEGVAQALHNLGNLAIERGEYVEARALHEEALTLRRGLSGKRDISMSLNNLGRLAMAQGDVDAARQMLQESLALAREVGGNLAVAGPLRHLGDLNLSQGNVDRAAEQYAECLRLACDIGAQMTIAHGIEGAAVVAHLRGDLAAATRLLAAADAIREAIRSPQVPTERTPCEPALAAARAGLGEAEFARVWQAGRTMPVEQAIELSFSSLRHEPASEGSPTSRLGGLSPRELEVVLLIARGLTNRQIADRLVISERTTHAHVRNILDKLARGSRIEVATWAVQQGLHKV